MISTDSIEMARQYCESVAPEEGCGFILDDGAVMPMRNVADRPGLYFQMDDREVVEVYKTRKIAAVFHSHPDGTQNWSERDRRFWVPNLVNVLIPLGGTALVESPFAGRDSRRVDR